MIDIETGNRFLKARRIRAAHDRVNQAQKELISVIQKEYPEQTEITWYHGEHLQRGTVVKTSRFTDCLWVKNADTGNTVRISYYSIYGVRS